MVSLLVSAEIGCVQRVGIARVFGNRSPTIRFAHINRIQVSGVPQAHCCLGLLKCTKSLDGEFHFVSVIIHRFRHLGKK